MSTKGLSKHWLSLGTACDLLEVNESTLRQWADNGLIRSYRTPGGHRRFSSEALRALMERRPESIREGKERQWSDRALQRVRRKLKGKQTISQHWYQGLSEEARLRMRLLGRRLLATAVDYATQHRRREDLLEEARLFGEEYGAEMVRQNMSLKDALEAFVFFRSFLLNAALGYTDGPEGDSERLWHSVNLLTDQVLLSASSSYSTKPVGATKILLSEGN